MIIKKSSDVNNIHAETVTSKYDFVGTYTTVEPDDIEEYCYILGSENAFVQPSSSICPMNWYLKIEQKGSAREQPSSQTQTIIINVVGESELPGGMGEECTDCPAVKVSKGDEEVILYDPDKVEFIKIPAE